MLDLSDEHPVRARARGFAHTHTQT